MNDMILLKREIQKSINLFYEQYQQNKLKHILQQTELRGYVTGLITEIAGEETENDPHELTGINVLEDLLKKILPTVESSYKKLTTSDEQRKSFRTHILNAVKGTLDPLRTTDAVTPDEGAIGEGNLDELSKDPRFIDVKLPSDKRNQKPKEDPKETFGIEGEDETGRNMAYGSYKQIEQAIVNAFSELGDPQDKSVFYRYLLTNLKLHMDRFENALAPTPEPMME